MQAEQEKILDAMSRLMNRLSAVMAEPRSFGTEYKLYTSEIQMIGVIGRNPGINVTEIAETLGITKGAVPKIIRKLLQKELIVRYQVPENKKEIHFDLTEKGKTAYLRHREFHQKVNQGIIEHFKALNREELAFLQGLLREIEDNLGNIVRE